MNLVKILKPLEKTAYQLLRSVKANRTTLYAIGATVGVVGTAAASAKAAVKTKEYQEEYADASFAEKAKFIGGLWVMPVVVGGVTIFCIWRGHKIHLEKEASLAAMSAFWKTKYDELDKKISEKLSEEEYKEVKDEIFKENVEKAANERGVNLAALSKGQFWVYDAITGQFMKVTADQMTWATYALNKRFMEGQVVQYNWFLGLLGGRPSELAKDVGWDPNNETFFEMLDYNNGFGIAPWLDVDADHHADINMDPVNSEGLPVAQLFYKYDPFYLYEK